MNTIKQTLYYIAATFICIACTHSRPLHEQPVTDLIDVVYGFNNRDIQWQDSVLTADSIPLAASLKVTADSTVAQWAESRAVKVFSPDAEAVFPDNSSVEENLGYILSRAEELNLNLPKRNYATVVYGRPESVLFVDSVMLIALNHFLGADYPGYAGLPVYMRQLKTPVQLPYALAEALVGTRFPFQSQEYPTLLEKMLYEGALIHAKMELVPDADPAAALGYSKEEFAEIRTLESEIWSALVQGKMIFDTSAMVIDRLCSPAPFVQLGTMRLPGRVGRFIGWRIVESYIRNNSDVTVAQLLSDGFYSSQDILSLAGYTPKN